MSSHHQTEVYPATSITASTASEVDTNGHFYPPETIASPRRSKLLSTYSSKHRMERIFGSAADPWKCCMKNNIINLRDQTRRLGVSICYSLLLCRRQVAHGVKKVFFTVFTLESLPFTLKEREIAFKTKPLHKFLIENGPEISALNITTYLLDTKAGTILINSLMMHLCRKSRIKRKNMLKVCLEIRKALKLDVLVIFRPGIVDMYTRVNCHRTTHSR